MLSHGPTNVHGRQQLSLKFREEWARSAAPQSTKGEVMLTHQDQDTGTVFELWLRFLRHLGKQRNAIVAGSPSLFERA